MLSSIVTLIFTVPVFVKLLMCIEMQQLSHGKHNEKIKEDAFAIDITFS